MQQYKRPEAIKRMNELAGSRKAFLFIIDDRLQCSFIEKGEIKEKDIRQEELSSYSFVRLFNAMIEWGALEFSTGTIYE